MVYDVAEIDLCGNPVAHGAGDEFNKVGLLV